jgi:hypothetical protein
VTPPEITVEAHEPDRDIFGAVALLLGVPAGEVGGMLPPGPTPPWLLAYERAPSRQARATLLAPRLLRLRLAVREVRVRWR